MRESHYSPAHSLGRVVNMSGLALSKICSSMLVLFNDQRVNIGLNLKFEAKGLKVLGYSRKGDGGWEYSQKAVELIQEYRDKFPEVAQALSRKGGESDSIGLVSSRKCLTSLAPYLDRPHPCRGLFRAISSRCTNEGAHLVDQG